MFIPAAELAVPTGTQTNEGNAEIETKPVTIETKISKYSTYLKYFYIILSFLLQSFRENKLI